jgi:glycosyltransferase involved in cell wall biosynthesis
VRSVSLVVPGRIDQRTGGYIYNRRMAEELRRSGWGVDVLELDASFPRPTRAALADAARVLAQVSSGALVVIDSLALGAMPELIALESPRLTVVALMHLPLAWSASLEGGTTIDVAAAERAALHSAARIVITGRAALPLLAPYELPADRVVVVEPGTDRAPLARGSGHTSDGSVPLELLCAATVNPIKGHEMLLEALAANPSQQWRLTCAGSVTRDPGTAARVRATIDRLGLADRVSLAGDLDENALATCFDSADVFVLATRQETYGMAVAEALARGLPVVSTRTGAIAELVNDEAGLVVPVDDRAALTAALTRITGEADLRARLAEGARRVRNRLRTWEEAGAQMAAALAPLTHG